MTHLLLVDDHPLYHAGLASLLRTQRPGFVLHSAHDATSGLELLRSATPVDLILVDIQLPGTDGFEAIRAYAAQRPFVPRVLISGREDLTTRQRASQCGASGFIAKSCPVEQALQIMDRVLEGGSGFDAPSRSAGAPSLTLRQMEVLSLLAQGKSNKQIGADLDIAERTVRAHLTELFNALGAQSRTQAILNAQSQGWIA